MCQHTDFRKFELIGQSFSAFSASSLQDVSAVSSSHSLSEAVLLFSLTLFGLIGSEHFLHLLVVVFVSNMHRSKRCGSVLLFEPKIRFIQ